MASISVIHAPNYDAFLPPKEVQYAKHVCIYANMLTFAQTTLFLEAERSFFTMSPNVVLGCLMATIFMVLLLMTKSIWDKIHCMLFLGSKNFDDNTDCVAPLKKPRKKIFVENAAWWQTCHLSYFLSCNIDGERLLREADRSCREKTFIFNLPNNDYFSFEMGCIFGLKKLCSAISTFQALHMVVKGRAKTKLLSLCGGATEDKCEHH